MHKETNYHCWNLNDDSNDIFPDRDAKGRFVKAMPKARVDNFKGL